MNKNEWRRETNMAFDRKETRIACTLTGEIRVRWSTSRADGHIEAVTERKSLFAPEAANRKKIDVSICRRERTKRYWLFGSVRDFFSREGRGESNNKRGGEKWEKPFETEWVHWFLTLKVWKHMREFRRTIVRRDREDLMELGYNTMVQDQLFRSLQWMWKITFCMKGSWRERKRPKGREERISTAVSHTKARLLEEHRRLWIHGGFFPEDKCFFLLRVHFSIWRSVTGQLPSEKKRNGPWTRERE